jgi:hypothetical protein
MADKPKNVRELADARAKVIEKLSKISLEWQRTGLEVAELNQRLLEAGLDKDVVRCW